MQAQSGPKWALGQRWTSENEAELGLGKVVKLEHRNVHVQFGGELRVYRKEGGPLKRFVLRAGDTAENTQGEGGEITEVRSQEGVLWYLTSQGEICESDLRMGSRSKGGSPVENLFEGHVSTNESYELRLRARQLQSRILESPIRGLVGPRIDAIPHQLRIAYTACSEPRIPRRLLSDEVGLGKTIEAGLIWHRLKVTGQVQRTLILVPESLTHQWLVEMYRRFHTLFTLIDDDYCASVEEGEPGANPFAQKQDVLTDMDFVLLDPLRMKQVLDQKWDLVIVDEAHRVDTGDHEDSPEYLFLEKLSKRSPGLLLLTATPIQLQLRAHYARLRLIDPARFGSFEEWEQEHSNYREVAGELSSFIDAWKNGDRDWTSLRAALPAGGRVDALLSRRSELLSTDPADALRLLCDMVGTGRSVVRNTRHAIGGFPVRSLHSYALKADPDYTQRVQEFWEDNKEDLEDDVSKVCMSLNGSLAFDKDFLLERQQRNLLSVWLKDEKVRWLIDLLKGDLSQEKVLILCSAREVVVGIKDALERSLPIETAMFFEDMPLVARDRAAAWFADPEGAQVLIASEIGSEGRNFQFAHHLVMFDLPLEPGLLEQRIGRLDRIGQRETIHIHVAYVEGTTQHRLFEWYEDGLCAFVQPMLGVEALYSQFEMDLARFIFRPTDRVEEYHQEFLPKVRQTAEALRSEIQQGRDKLMEFNSHDPEHAASIVAKVRDWDEDIDCLSLILEALEWFGVEVAKGPAAGSWIAKPSSHLRMQAEAVEETLGDDEGGAALASRNDTGGNIPHLPPEGLTMTGDRRVALDREDIAFLSMDHPLTQSVLDILCSMEQGRTAFALAHGLPKGIYFEFLFQWEPQGDASWNLQRLFIPRCLRVLTDRQGRDCSALIEELDEVEINDNQAGLLPKLQAHLGDHLSGIVSAGEALAQKLADAQSSLLHHEALRALEPEIQRLQFLGKDDPKALKRAEQLQTFGPAVLKAFKDGSLRLDAFRVVIAN
jgi:ATP-dependent helicase HepA